MAKSGHFAISGVGQKSGMDDCGGPTYLDRLAGKLRCSDQVHGKRNACRLITIGFELKQIYRH